MVNGDGGGLRLAELVAAFSLGTDLGLGQPMEHVLRSWRIAAGLGERIGLDEAERVALYYVALLAWVGCVADSYEVATWFGDDIAFRADSYEVDLAGLPMLGFMLRHVGAGSPTLHRLRLATTLISTRGQAVQRGLISHCISTARLGEQLGLGPDVCEPLKQMFARWDGKGVPPDVRGDRIALSIRLFHVADIVEVHYHQHGVDAALEIARERRGAQFDPDIVDEFCRPRARPAANDRRRDRLDRSSSTPNPACDRRSPSPRSTTRSKRSPTSPTCGRRTSPGTHAALPISPPPRLVRSDSPKWRSCSPDAPGCFTTSVAMASPRPSGTNPGRSPPPSANAYGCTPTTPNGCWRGPRCSPSSERSPRHITNGSTAPAITVASRAQRFPCPEG